MEKVVCGSSTADLVKQLGDRLGIGKSKFYELKKQLNFEFHKDDEGVWLDADQLAALENAVTGQSHIVVAQSVEMETHAEELQAETVSMEETSYQELIRSAQELAAGMAIARYQLAGQIDEDNLPLDLRQKVEEARQRTIPKSKSPEAIAKDLMQKAKAMMVAA
jgi:hypothetical protein